MTRMVGSAAGVQFSVGGGVVAQLHRFLRCRIDASVVGVLGEAGGTHRLAVANAQRKVRMPENLVTLLPAAQTGPTYAIPTNLKADDQLWPSGQGGFSLNGLIERRSISVTYAIPTSSRSIGDAVYKDHVGIPFRPRGCLQRKTRPPKRAGLSSA